MKTKRHHPLGRQLLTALAPGLMLLLSSCSSTPPGETTSAAAYTEGVPGGIAAQRYQVTATVTAIDSVRRKVTLVTPEGKSRVFKAGPGLADFSRIQIGDRVQATVTDEIVVYLAERNAATVDGAARLVALGSEGNAAGALTAETLRMTAKVTAIDAKKRRVTLQFEDGTVRTVTVRKDIDLTQRAVGDEVVIACTEAVALVIERP